MRTSVYFMMHLLVFKFQVVSSLFLFKLIHVNTWAHHELTWISVLYHYWREERCIQRFGDFMYCKVLPLKKKKYRFILISRDDQIWWFSGPKVFLFVIVCENFGGEIIPFGTSGYRKLSGPVNHAIQFNCCLCVLNWSIDPILITQIMRRGYT